MAYTYLIGWSKYKKYYYGVRYAVDSSPEELWKTYFTSSDYVKDFVKNNGDPDIIQIRKTFDDSQKAREWEWKVLRKMKVVYKEEWINKCDQISIPSMRGDSNPMKRQDVKNKHLEKMQSREYREKMSAIKKGKRHSEESKRKQSEIAKSRGIGKWNLGIKKSSQTKTKMSESAAQRPRKLCPKCNQGYTNANYDKHFNSCDGQRKALYKKCEDGVMRKVE